MANLDKDGNNFVNEHGNYIYLVLLIILVLGVIAYALWAIF